MEYCYKFDFEKDPEKTKLGTEAPNQEGITSEILAFDKSRDSRYFCDSSHVGKKNGKEEERKK